MARRSGRYRNVASMPMSRLFCTEANAPSSPMPTPARPTATDVPTSMFDDSVMSLYAAGAADVGELGSPVALEHFRRAAVHLAGELQVKVRRVDQMRERQAGVREPLVAADEVPGHERAVRRRQGVGVERVHFAELRAHLPHLEEQVRRQRRERDVALLDLRAFGTQGDEEVGLRVGIDDGLERRLDFAQLQRRQTGRTVLARGADEVAVDRDVGIEHLRTRGRGGGAGAGAAAAGPPICASRCSSASSRSSVLPAERFELALQPRDFLTNLLHVGGRLAGRRGTRDRQARANRGHRDDGAETSC